MTGNAMLESRYETDGRERKTDRDDNGERNIVNQKIRPSERLIAGQERRRET